MDSEESLVSSSQEVPIVKPKGKKKDFISPIAKTTRKKNIDFSKLGQKMTLSNSSCHKCKTMIPVNEENICRGPVDVGKKGVVSKKKSDQCTRRFCNECLQKQYRESWVQRQKNPETWICPVCLDNCNCSQCTRKRTKEGQLKTQFLAQFDQPEKINKRIEKEKFKHQKSLKVVSHQTLAEQKKSYNKKVLQPVPTIQTKFAITKEDWDNYKKSQQNFLQVLNKHDWSDIPTIDKIKQKMNLEQKPFDQAQQDVEQIQT